MGQFVESEIIVAVMGQTGVGKSSFIRTVTGQNVVVGHSLESCTQYPQPIRCQHPDGSGRTIVFLDTPGFNDTNVSDTDILRHIADWLVKAYHNKMKLTGLLYLHRITDSRVTATSVKNLALFRELCGTENLKNVILMTTFWDVVDGATGERREEQLKNDFWRKSLSGGAQIDRFRNSHQSGWSIVNRIVGKPPVVAHVVDQIVNQGMSIEQTSAGAMVRIDLEAKEAEHRRQIEAMELEHKRQMKLKEEEEQRIRREQEERHRQEQARLEEERRQAERQAEEERAREQQAQDALRASLEGTFRAMDEWGQNVGRELDQWGQNVGRGLDQWGQDVGRGLNQWGQDVGRGLDQWGQSVGRGDCIIQ